MDKIWWLIRVITTETQRLRKVYLLGFRVSLAKLKRFTPELLSLLMQEFFEQATRKDPQSVTMSDLQNYLLAVASGTVCFFQCDFLTVRETNLHL